MGKGYSANVSNIFRNLSGSFKSGLPGTRTSTITHFFKSSKATCTIKTTKKDGFSEHEEKLIENSFSKLEIDLQASYTKKKIFLT
jgi:hypothetical protein